jgi:ssDNA-binding Zn-finger/Zn-ribbon topoisomerase 1
MSKKAMEKQYDIKLLKHCSMTVGCLGYQNCKVKGNAEFWKNAQELNSMI